MYTSYMFLRVSEGRLKIIIRFKVKEWLLGLSGVIVERFNVFESRVPSGYVCEV